MEISGKLVSAAYEGRTLTICNQRSDDWTHPYPYQNEGNLTNSGCGIFSTVHAVEWMTGKLSSAEELADFSVRCGGRGDDGTDRPVLLRAMEEKGLAKKLGFSYAGEELRNDLDALYAHISQHKGTALCNLRVGHIVTLIDVRNENGCKQVLAIDSNSESDSIRIFDQVCEVLPGSEVISSVKNAHGLICGFRTTYALYWAKLDIVRDFNLLHTLPVK